MPRIISNGTPRPFLDVLREELAAAEPWVDEDLLALWVEKQKASHVSVGGGADICRLGDLWTLGNHRLLCGDSTNKETVMRLMGAKKADLLITDPPYGVSFKRGQFITEKRDYEDKVMEIVNDNRKGSDQRDFITEVFAIATLVCSEGTPIYMFAASMREGVMSFLGLLEAEVHVQSQLIWAKDTMVLGQADYQWQHEVVWYGWFAGSHKWYGGRQHTTVLDCRRIGKTYHPNEKPVELLEKMICNSSLPGALCYEPFTGSGSMLIACERTSRVCYGLELDPHFCDVALKRWADYTGVDPVREDVALFKELSNAK